MKISKLTTDNGVKALELVQQVKAPTLRKWCRENDLEPGRKAEMQERLSTAIVEQIVCVEQHDPRVQIWPEFRYSCVAQMCGLEEHERLNIMDFQDEREEWDELFDDLPSRLTAPMDKRTQVYILMLQTRMEQHLMIVDMHSSPAFHKRDVQRKFLDRHMKAWIAAGSPESDEHKEWTFKLKAANTRAREAAKAAGREKNETVARAWEAFNLLKEAADRAMGTAKAAYYGFIAEVAPFVPKCLSRGDKLTMRKKRIEWLQATIMELEAELELEEVDHLAPNWITRDDDQSRRYDDFMEHSYMLNRGEDLRDAHCREMWDGRPDVHLKLRWREYKWEMSEGEKAYNE